MAALPIPGADVELTDERVRHIRRRHHDVLDDWAFVTQTLREPDIVGERGDGTLGFLRRLGEPRDGHWLVICVRSDRDAAASDTMRYWIVTMWIGRRLGRWRIVWERS